MTPPAPRVSRRVLLFWTVAALAAVPLDAHQVLLPGYSGVIAPPLAVHPPPALLLRTSVPVVVPNPSQDHVSPVLRAGQPAILLLPHTPSSGLYQLSDSQHRFPPFLENVVNRVQNYFSSYVQIDPFSVPFATSRPPMMTLPPSSDNSTVAAITTTTTTTTSARANSQGLDVRVPAVPRDVELLSRQLHHASHQASHQVSQQAQQATGGPVAFATAVARVRDPGDPQADGVGSGPADSYLPVHTNGPSNTVEERPPAVPTRPSRPPTSSNTPSSYYRRP